MGIFGRGVSFVLVLIAAIAAVPLPATGQGASPSPIEWKNSVSSPGGAASAAVVLGNPAPRHVVVQFGAPLKPGAR